MAAGKCALLALDVRYLQGRRDGTALSAAKQRLSKRPSIPAVRRSAAVVCDQRCIHDTRGSDGTVWNAPWRPYEH